jgi:hypothetical protein
MISTDPKSGRERSMRLFGALAVAALLALLLRSAAVVVSGALQALINVSGYTDEVEVSSLGAAMFFVIFEKREVHSGNEQ